MNSRASRFVFSLRAASSTMGKNDSATHSYSKKCTILIGIELSDYQ
jgi:hypothetical protein